MNYQDIVNALPQLSAADRAKVAQACSILGSASGKEVSAREKPAERMWLAYVAAASEVGVQLPPVLVARRSAPWPQFVETCDGVDKWATRAFGIEDETEAFAAFKKMASLLIARVRDWAPLAVPVLLRVTKDAPAVVESNFPGYAKSGLLRRFVLLQAHRQT